MKEYVIALIDCDSFFVSCERAINNHLNHQPICVVTGENGCVVSRSKEAKIMGVKMGMPLFMAKKIFPAVVYKNAQHEIYKSFSNKVMHNLQQILPNLEIVSIDEAYADMTSLDKVYKMPYPLLAKWIRKKIWQNTSIPISIGLAPSKLLAKLASDKAKSTEGVFQIKISEIQQILKSTDITEISGIGRSYTKKMTYNGIFTAWDFVCQPDQIIKKQMGIMGLDLKYELLGYYMRHLETHQTIPQSIQDTSVLPCFTSDINVLKSQLYYHLHQACRRMRKNGCLCTIAGIMLRTKDFTIFSDKLKLPCVSDCELEIAQSLIPLLNKTYQPNILYRSSGVILSELVSKQNYQQDLFNQSKIKNSSLSQAWDLLEDKFGKNILKKGWI